MEKLAWSHLPSNTYILDASNCIYFDARSPCSDGLLLKWALGRLIQWKSDCCLYWVYKPRCNLFLNNSNYFSVMENWYLDKFMSAEIHTQL